jgi:hypothetical protein
VAEKETVMRLKFATDIPAMPSSGYGSGSPANSNQDWFAADVVGTGVTPGRFTPNKWARQASALADFHLQNGRPDNTGWSNFQQSSDITNLLHTPQGRYQASIPGTVAHQTMQAHKSGIRDEANEKKEATIQHLDTFASKLQTAATSLAYLTGASGGVANAMNRAASVFAAFQGVSGVSGMGGGSIGSAIHGLGSAVASGGMGSIAAGGMMAGGLALGGLMGADSLLQSWGGKSYLGDGGIGNIGSNVMEGSNRNIVASMAHDWNRFRVNTVGGGKVNDNGKFISQEQQLATTIHGQHALRMNSFMGTQSLEGTRLGILGERQGMESQIAGFSSQFQGYDGFAAGVGYGEVRGGQWNKHNRDLSEQPMAMKGLMDRIYNNDYQASGELASRMQGIGQQARGYAVRSQTLSAQYTGLQNVIGSKRGQLREVQANTAAAADRDGPNSGSVHASREKEKQINQEILSLLQQETQIKKQIREVDTDILKEKQQQALVTQQMLQSVINSERAGQGQDKLSYGRLDPGQRQYVKSVLERFDKGGEGEVAHDEMSIVEQYRRREAEKIYRKRADDEGFSDKGTMRDKIIGDAESELKNQKQLELNLARQIDFKLEVDNKALLDEFMQGAGPLISKIRLEMRELGGKVLQIAEGMQQLQSNTKTPPGS